MGAMVWRIGDRTRVYGPVEKRHELVSFGLRKLPIGIFCKLLQPKDLGTNGANRGRTGLIKAPFGVF